MKCLLCCDQEYTRIDDNPLWECNGCGDNLTQTHYEKIEAMQKVIEKLPKTADGVPVVPGMITWCGGKFPFGHHWDMRLRDGESFGSHCIRQDEKQYSTPEAANCHGPQPCGECPDCKGANDVNR